jgi:hypothetical protein
MTGDIQICSGTQKRRVVLACDIDQSLGAAVIGKPDFGHQALVAVFFAVVELLEHCRRDQVGHAVAASSPVGHQGDHSAGLFRRAAVVVGALPEAPLPVADTGRLARQPGKIGFKNQRAVGKQPHRLLIVNGIHVALNAGRVGRHRRRSIE